MFSVEAQFQCRTRLCGWCSDLSKVFDALGDEVSMPHAALWVVQHYLVFDIATQVGFNAARGFVGGAAAQHAQR